MHSISPTDRDVSGDVRRRYPRQAARRSAYRLPRPFAGPSLPCLSSRLRGAATVGARAWHSTPCRRRGDRPLWGRSGSVPNRSGHRDNRGHPTEPAPSTLPGKSDTRDAEAAAISVLAGSATAQPKAHSSLVEATLLVSAPSSCGNRSRASLVSGDSRRARTGADGCSCHSCRGDGAAIACSALPAA